MKCRYHHCYSKWTYLCTLLQAVQDLSQLDHEMVLNFRTAVFLCWISDHLPCEESSYWSWLSNKIAEGAFPLSSESGVKICMVEPTSVVVNVWSMPTSHSKAAVVVFTVVTESDWLMYKTFYNLYIWNNLVLVLSSVHIFVENELDLREYIRNILEKYLNRKVIYNRLCIAKKLLVRLRTGCCCSWRRWNENSWFHESFC